MGLFTNFLNHLKGQTDQDQQVNSNLDAAIQTEIKRGNYARATMLQKLQGSTPGRSSVASQAATGVGRAVLNLPQGGRAITDALASRMYQPQVEAANKRSQASDNALMRAIATEKARGNTARVKQLTSMLGSGKIDFERDILGRGMTTPQEAASFFGQLAALAVPGMKVPKVIEAAPAIPRLILSSALRGGENAAVQFPFDALASGGKQAIKNAGTNFVTGAAVNALASPKLLTKAVEDLPSGFKRNVVDPIINGEKLPAKVSLGGINPKPSQQEIRDLVEFTDTINGAQKADPKAYNAIIERGTTVLRKMGIEPSQDNRVLTQQVDSVLKSIDTVKPFTKPGGAGIPDAQLAGVGPRMQAREGKIDFENPGPAPTRDVVGPQEIKAADQKFFGPNPEADPVQTIITALKEAKPLTKEQQALYNQGRKKQFAQMMSARGRQGGESGFRGELGALKGGLPKVQFETLRGKISQEHIDGLFNKVNEANIGEWEKITAKSGLAKILGESGGSLPTPSEQSLLHDVFGAEFTQTLLDKRSTWQKFLAGSQEALNLPRSLMASFDVSAPLRQGVFFIGRPKQWAPAVVQMLKSFGSEKAYRIVQDQISSRPTYKLMREAKLALTDAGPLIANREERFMSNLGEKIPVVGVGVRASDRAYTAFLNKLRADTFDDLYSKAQALGIDRPGLTDDLAKFINSATGRGDLGSLNKAVPVLNGIFFSPRLMASRLNLLNPAYYAKLDPFVRKEALKSLFTMTAVAGTALGLAKAGGASVGTDPRSADFGKIRVGNTRYDILGGFQQYIVLASRLLSGSTVSSITGKEQSLTGGYKPTTRKDIIIKFLQSKENPVLSFVTGMLDGTDQAGSQFRVMPELVDRFLPMITQDINDIAQEKGFAQAVGMAIPSSFGVGVQTYGKEIPVPGKTSSGKDNVQWRSTPSVGEEIWNKVTGQKVTSFSPEQQAQLIAGHKPTGGPAFPTDNSYVESADAPKNILETLGLYGKGIVKDPANTIEAMFTNERLRKVTGDTAIFERKNGLGAQDNGDQSTQVDHKVALALGGSNNESNLQVLSKEENAAKGIVETHLMQLLSQGKITKQEAQKRDLNWKDELSALGLTVEKAKAAAPIDSSGTVLSSGNGKFTDLVTGKVYNSQSAAQEARAKALVSSGQSKMEQVGDKVFRIVDGKVKVTNLSSVNTSTAKTATKVGLDKAKTAGDLETWTAIQASEVKRLQDLNAKLDPRLDADVIAKNEKAINTIAQQVVRYQKQGGFKKPKKGKSAKVRRATLTKKVGTSKTFKITTPKLSSKKVKLPSSALKISTPKLKTQAIRVRRLKSSAPRTA
jgi:hypothetical protein